MFMLNCGGAEAMAFPDVCLTPVPTPAGPVPTPIPYPNMASTAMANPATVVDNVLVVGMPALNLGSEITVTEGDEPGVDGGVVSLEVMQMARFAAGSACVMVRGVPAVRLTSMTLHNGALPNAEGAVVVPSQVVVLVLS